MRWKDGRRSSNIEDRRGQRPTRSGFGFPMGGSSRARSGGTGLVGIIIIVVIAMLLGVNPLQLLSGGGGMMHDSPAGQSAPPQQQSAAEQQLADFVSVVLADTEDTWGALFAGQNGQYVPPRLVLYRDVTQTGCGYGQAAAGPFYCPADQKIYLDLSFFEQLSSKFGAPGDFAAAYVIAHEVGHHIQTVTGISEQVRKAQSGVSKVEANALQVRMELQADCFSGIWAHNAQRSRQVLEQGDIEEALGAATAVGDDTIMRKAQGRVVPDAFTHGSAEQRKRWFLKGLESGQPGACDTFAARDL